MLFYIQIQSLSETQVCQLHAHKNLNPNESSSDADTDADDVTEFRPAVPIAVLSAVYLAKVLSILTYSERHFHRIFVLIKQPTPVSGK